MGMGMDGTATTGTIMVGGTITTIATGDPADIIRSITDVIGLGITTTTMRPRLTTHHRRTPMRRHRGRT